MCFTLILRLQLLFWDVQSGKIGNAVKFYISVVVLQSSAMHLSSVDVVRSKSKLVDYQKTTNSNFENTKLLNANRYISTSNDKLFYTLLILISLLFLSVKIFLECINETFMNKKNFFSAPLKIKFF